MGTSSTLTQQLSFTDNRSIVSPVTESSPAISLGLTLHEAQISGDVSLGAGSSFATEPTIKIGLGGVKAYVELDLSASAGIQESIQLFASPELSIDLLEILKVELGVAFALDLVLEVDAKVDLSAGFYLSFDDSAFVEVSLLTKDVVDVSLDGLTAHALPIAVAAGVDLSAAITLQVGLRLRSQIHVGAGVDLVGIDVGAEAVIAIWVNLFDYTAVLISTEDCLLSIKEDFALAIGVAIDVDIKALNLLDISLAPHVFITLADISLDLLCIDDIPTPSHGGNDHSASASATVTATSVSTLPTATHSHVGNSTMSHTMASHTTAAPESLVTSTTLVTSTYTITSCAAHVKNCPADYTQVIVTSTIYQETTICPVTQTAAPATSTKAPVPVKTITETLTTLVPCETRSSSTFTAPTEAPPAPTVIIDDTTTVCPATETTKPSASGPGSVPASTTAIVAPTTSSAPAGPVVTIPYPSSGNGTNTNTWTSVWVAPTGAPTTSAPPAAAPPTTVVPAPVPTNTPVVGSAAALKAGFVALALPAVLVALF